MEKKTQEKYIAVVVTLVATFILLLSGLKFFNPINQTAAPVAATDSAVSSAKSVDPNQYVIEDLAIGSGAATKSGDTVTVNYVGTLVDGTKFDSSIDREDPLTFEVGAKQLITGFDNGVVGMKVGGKRKLTIPANLGYGENAIGPIPANSVLIFEVELLKIASK